MIIASSRYDVIAYINSVRQRCSEILAVLVKAAEIHAVNHPVRFYIQ